MTWQGVVGAGHVPGTTHPGRRLHRPGRLAVAGTFAAATIFIAACSQAPVPGHVGYDGNAGLDAFDRAHPQCELWTDWQKMCSRTGPGGSTWCATDPGRRVEASAPFCITREGEDRARPTLQTLTREQSASLHRFCRPELAIRGPTGIKGEECGFDPSRPFNGYRLAARLHPWCTQWNEAVTKKPVCATEGGGKLPDCAELGQAGFENETGFYCARRALPDWCTEAGGLGIEVHYEGPGDILPVGERQEAFTVRGMYCSRRR